VAEVLGAVVEVVGVAEVVLAAVEVDLTEVLTRDLQNRLL